LLHRELQDEGPSTSELGSRAAELLEAAAHAASGRGDLQGAASFLERALPLVEQGDPRHSGLLLELSDALAELGELRRAQELLRTLLQEVAADELLRARARIQLWEIRSSSENVAGWKAEATRDLLEATALFRRNHDHLGLAKALNLEALIDEYDYRFGESAAALESALEHARRAGDEKEETKIFYAYVRSSLFGPVHVDEALSRYAQFRARFPDNRLVEANCLRGMALLQAMKGRFEEALALLGRYGELLADLGLGLGASKSLTPGMVEMLIGDYQAAERTFRKSYDELGRAGERNTRAITAAYLARALYEQGRQDEAHEMTKVSEELAPEDDFTTMIEWASVRAKVLARRGEGAEADLMTRRVVALAAETDELETRATTLLDRAEVLRVLGRAEDATPCIEEALALYERKGDIASRARARAMLDAPLVIDLREQEAARR
jgi:tetratricopeptide (TPR) repeat protein